MSGKATGMAWELDIPHNQQFVLLAMADHADHNGGSIYPGTTELAWKTGYSERQVRRIIKQLRDAKILDLIAERYGKYKTNCYRIVWANAKKKQPCIREDILTPDILTPDKMPVDKSGTWADIQMSGNPSVYPSEDSLSEIDEVTPKPHNDLAGITSPIEIVSESPKPGTVITVYVTPPEIPDEPPPFKQDLPSLGKGYQWVVSSAVGTSAHIARSVKGHVLCAASVRHRESLTAPIGQRPPCAECQAAYEKALKPEVVSLKPHKDAALKTAVALHIQEFKPGHETTYTGLLAQVIARYWRQDLQTDDLSAEQYAAIARSVPIFVKWYRLFCPGMHLPTKQDALEEYYTKFPKKWRPGDPVRKAEQAADDDLGPMPFVSEDGRVA
jgi:hypothetical protein